jgi:hypothetical protein
MRSDRIRSGWSDWHGVAMRQALAALALTVAAVTLTASPVIAAPTPERMQGWANKKQSYEVLIDDKEKTLRNTPLELIREIDAAYDSMQTRLKLKDAYEANPELATTGLGLSHADARAIIGQLRDVADQGSEYVDIHRQILTHSPDKSLNKLTDRALNDVGDVFDAVKDKKYISALEDSYSANARWAKIETKLKSYGVDTGEAWTLSGNVPADAARSPPQSVTYDLTGQGTATVTMQNASGGTEQFETPLPYHLDLGGYTGFVYISAQLEDTGTVTCTIKRGEEVIQTATSTGQYVIASCSGEV